jgi:hypothetical protein
MVEIRKIYFSTKVGITSAVERVRRIEMKFIDRINSAVAKSPAGTWFRLDGSNAFRVRQGSFFSTEIRAGLATFFAMVHLNSPYTPWALLIIGIYYCCQLCNFK